LNGYKNIILIQNIMLKKRQLTNKLQGTSGGWAVVRSVKYKGVGHAYGIKYHQVFPIVSSGEWQEMLAWCVDIFGHSGTEDKPGVWSPDQRWYANSNMLWFKDIKDCEWFLLRWQ
jgi:hypothetical protein